MHLLNTLTLELKYFPSEIPPYAILSHTWGDEEVTFDDIDKPHASSMTGYQKILGCCAQAREDGLEWAWIDTCCIDKKSSAELSEAINSMYDWYWQSEVCYAYLSDVPDKPFIQSAWFRRGWTLQELLAPSIVEFYSQDWQHIGMKSELVVGIRRATGIGRRYIADRGTIKYACVGERFGWASHRETTRTEDVAYCLLGILGVNMSLLYGEGPRAFHRLQQKVMKQTTDHTIFAWEHIYYGLDQTAIGTLCPPSDREYVEPNRQIRGLEAHSPHWGLLAPSPMWFSNYCVRNIHPSVPQFSQGDRSIAHELTNMGLAISLPCRQYDDKVVLAVLRCETMHHKRIAVWLQGLATGRYARVAGKHLVELDENQAADLQTLHMYVEAQTHGVVISNKLYPFKL